MRTLHDFMIDQLHELYNAELQLKMLVEKMAFKTSNEKLRHSFEKHGKEAEKQLAGLERIFSLLGVPVNDRRYSYIAEGLGNEIQAFMEKDPEAEVLDAGFIALLQKGKHYEIALYGTIREYAHQLQNTEAERILTEMLHEVKENDRHFTEKARSGVNQRASDPDALPSNIASTGR